MPDEVRCEVCGSRPGGSESHCLSCGTAFPIAPQSAVAEPSTPPSPPAPSRRSRGIAVIGIAGSLAAVVFLVVTFRHQPESVATDRPTALSAPSSPVASPSLPAAASSKATGDTTEPAPVRPKKHHARKVVLSLDPCAGQAYPFEYALSVSAAAPPTGSDQYVAVKNVQRILANLGYQGLSRTVPIAVDGWFGDHTRFAVKNFQRDNGIEAVGTVYRQTWAALGDHCGS